MLVGTGHSFVAVASIPPNITYSQRSWTWSISRCYLTCLTWSRTNPRGPSPQQSIGDQLQAMLNRSDQGRPLTTEDMNRFEILKFVASEKRIPKAAKPDQPKKDKDNLGTRAFNLCGWAHLQTHELHHLHRCNNGGWIEYNKATDKGEKESIIDTYFIQPLITKNGRFRDIITTEFRKLLIAWRLAPTNFEGSKPHGGLGPLSFVTRSTAERESLEYYRTLNAQLLVTLAGVDWQSPILSERFFFLVCSLLLLPSTGSADYSTVIVGLEWLNNDLCLVSA